jgi:hypothetical protein
MLTLMTDEPFSDCPSAVTVSVQCANVTRLAGKRGYGVTKPYWRAAQNVLLSSPAAWEGSMYSAAKVEPDCPTVRKAYCRQLGT